MPSKPLAIALVAIWFVTACGAASHEDQRARAVPALSALKRGDFRSARDQSESTLRDDPDNTHAALVRAITRYEKAVHGIALDLRTLSISAAMGSFNERYFRSTLDEAERELEKVDADLVRVERDESFTIDLCVACWEIDWNGNGRIDRSDRLLFQVERDADGKPVPEDDPRRKPTFRLDHGDVHWARAFVAFERAAIDLVLAYDWQDLTRQLGEERRNVKKIRLRLVHPERVHASRDRILEGLHQSDEARKAYLAETDDEREWLPSPRQKSHALPLPVDGALYQTWEDVVRDLERLMRGEEGLRLADLVEPGDTRSPDPRGYLDIGRLFSEPRDIVIDLEALERFDHQNDVEGATRSLFGHAYARRMRASPLPQRLRRMKRDVDRGNESLERKLQYLFWIN